MFPSRGFRAPPGLRYGARENWDQEGGSSQIQPLGPGILGVGVSKGSPEKPLHLLSSIKLLAGDRPQGRDGRACLYRKGGKLELSGPPRALRSPPLEALQGSPPF